MNQQVVWKYAMPPASMWRILEIAQFANVVKSSTQRNTLQAWFRLNPEDPPVKRHFLTVPTGEMVSSEFIYHDTIFEGALVWHIFEDPTSMGQPQVEGRDYI